MNIRPLLALGLALTTGFACLAPTFDDDDDDSAPLWEPGDLVISELMATPAPGRGAWVELYNPSGSARSIEGCTIGGAAIDVRVEIPAGSFGLLAEDLPIVPPGDPLAILARWPASAVSFDGSLSLVCDDVEIDTVTPAALPGGAAEAAMLEPGSLSASANDEPGQWCPAPDAYADWGAGDVDLGTPGAGNDCEGLFDSDPCAGELELAELMIAPSGGLTEWFEIRNTAVRDLDLSGCVIREGAGTSWNDQVLGSDGSGDTRLRDDRPMLLLKSPPLYPGGPEGDYDYGSLGFNNSGAERLEILCPCDGGELQLVDAVDYEWTGGSEESGRSLTRQPGTDRWCLADDSQTFWSDGEARIIGTPGQPNADCPPPLPLPAPGEVIFSELMIRPTAGTGAEWFELWSVADGPRSLVGCRLEEGHSTTPHEHAFDALRVPSIDPQSGLVFARGDWLGECGAPDYRYDSISLNDSGEELMLICPDGRGGEHIIDHVVHDGGMTTPGRSLMLHPDAVDATANDRAASWCAAPMDGWSCGAGSVQDYGSPGSLGTCEEL